MDIIVFRVKDSWGETMEAVVSDMSDTVFICGLRTPDGMSPTFESETYHLEGWAEEHGFTVERFEIILDLDARKATWL